MGHEQCKHCGSMSTRKNGVRDGCQRYYCTNCNREFRERIEEIKRDGSILIIGDLHAPYEHKDYLAFCKRIAVKYDVEEVYDGPEPV